MNDENSLPTPPSFDQQFDLLPEESPFEPADLQSNVNDNYPSNNHVYETDSDSHDERPTEATDDGMMFISLEFLHICVIIVSGNLPDQPQVDPDERSIQISFHHEPSPDPDGDICSPVDETAPHEENLSSDVVDFDSICDTKPNEPSPVLCKQSLCEPCTIEKDDITIIKESLTTTTTTTLTTKYNDPKKDSNDLGHIMISYNHSTKLVCSRIAKALKDRNYSVWIDQDNISGDILTSMASAVENAFVVLMAINEQYFKSRYCRLEAEYSLERNKASIPMLMQRDYIQFQLQFDQAFDLLVREIENIRVSLGADGDYQTSNFSTTTSCNSTRAMTTMSSSWLQYQDVNDWNTYDVVEWLNREKLEMFEDVLRLFTGATLWQLYKIKFDSPSDYYRTVESLLAPTVPLRVFYILTFHGAIESLFSSFSQRKH
ncbi:unnamed protein product [Adineta ricciae]|uniref:TIR domain-containing protein n=1 Tax=Adineta ricciae TaxID=249248 RepID=A0A815PTZ8_ADIRI|nr:unnamed protein product [Adineta ricciae]CAF1454488.1 unnamed protein product [Adineta ricciae]